MSDKQVSARRIARSLLDIKAVFLRPDDPFTWASGIKSPIYCDNRLTLSYPDVREVIEEGICECLKESFPDVQCLMGTATAGIAHAAIAAHKLGLPMGYVRGSSKDHGRKNQIEGTFEPGCNVVVIEDLISTAGSVLDCVEVLRQNDARVIGIISIFTYGMQRAYDRLEEARVRYESLCSLDVLVDVAVEGGYIRPEDKSRLLRFRSNPQDESWMSA